MTKHYIQPKISVVRFMNANLMQTVSPAAASTGTPINTGVETDDQW